MDNKEVGYGVYLWKSFKWVVGNAAFGLAPILFMWTVFLASETKIGHEEVLKMVHDGVVHFVCCAIMGAVWIDYFLSDFRFEDLDSLKFIAIYIIPFFVLGWVCLKFFLVVDGKISSSCFDMYSTNTIFITAGTFIYCLFIKTSFFIKEGEKNE